MSFFRKCECLDNCIWPLFEDSIINTDLFIERSLTQSYPLFKRVQHVDNHTHSFLWDIVTRIYPFIWLSLMRPYVFSREINVLIITINPSLGRVL